MSLITINVADCMHDAYLRGTLWQASNTLYAMQIAATNIAERVVESNQHAAETHAFWQQVQHYTLWGLAVLALIFREHAQKLIVGAITGAGEARHDAADENKEGEAPMNKKFLIAVAVLVSAAGLVFGQSNNAPIGLLSTNQVTGSRPISGVVTNAIISLSNATNGAVPGVGIAAGEFAQALYNYVSTNGHVAVGLGNTLDQLGKKKFAPVTTESYDLPVIIPTNKVVDVMFDAITSQLYAPNKTHLGLGAGAYTVWNIGWLSKLHLGPFQAPQGLELGGGVEPDMDKTVSLKFARKTTVAEALVQLRLYF